MALEDISEMLSDGIWMYLAADRTKKDLPYSREEWDDIYSAQPIWHGQFKSIT